jgi:hypothetical protein
VINDLCAPVEVHQDTREVVARVVAQVDESCLYVVGQYVSTEVQVIDARSQQSIVRESCRADNFVTEVRFSQLRSVELYV